MDVVVKAHHCTVTDRFREYVTDKITKLEKLNHRVIRVEVEVSAEKNKRQHDTASRVEITLRTKGPVVRAEASTEDKTAAFDMALDRLMAQLRKAADRKRVHHGQRRPISLAEATAGGDRLDPAAPQDDEMAADDTTTTIGGIQVQGDGPMLVREKIHHATPMTLDQALMEMELVGHDFFLFVDAESARPSVVYRRRGYDYGVIHLETTDGVERADAELAASNGHR